MGVIPQKLIIGFNSRKETYTGKLGYVCYLKGKNNDTVHQQSLSSWADKKIPFEYYDNIPTEGFVLNKKAGGTSWGWNTRMIKARVYDPRGFEFEIDMENLLYILENTNTIKGKALEGEFVYGWMGSGSVSLIPVDSEAYKEHFKTELAISKAKDITPLKKTELVVGRIYVTRKEELVLYTGGKFGFDNFLNLGTVTENKNKINFEYDWRQLKSKTVYKEHDIQGQVTWKELDLESIIDIDQYQCVTTELNSEIISTTDKNYSHSKPYQIISINNFIPNELFEHKLGVEYILESEQYYDSSEDIKIKNFLKTNEFKIKYPELNLIVYLDNYCLLMSDNYIIKTQLHLNLDNRWKRKGEKLINRNRIETSSFESINRETKVKKYHSNSYYNDSYIPDDLKLKLVKEIIIK